VALKTLIVAANRIVVKERALALIIMQSRRCPA
jgi:hypothetical protein